MVLKNNTSNKYNIPLFPKVLQYLEKSKIKVNQVKKDGSKKKFKGKL